MGQQSDRTETPERKLAIHLEQAMEFGKEFDERSERFALGLDPPSDRDPIHLEARRTIGGKLPTTPDEIEAVRQELGQAGMATSVLDLKAQNLTQERTIDDLRKQIAKMQGNDPAGKPPTISAPKAGAHPTPQGSPNRDWSVEDLKAWHKAKSLPEIAFHGAGRTKEVVLAEIVVQAQEAGIL